MIQRQFDAQPHEIVLDRPEALHLQHAAINDYWTVSYTNDPEHDFPYRFVTHHSPLGAAVFETTPVGDNGVKLNEHLLQVATLGALGLSNQATGSQLHLAMDTIRTRRRQIRALLDIAPSNGPSIEPIIATCFDKQIFRPLLRLPTTPKALRSDRIQQIVEAVGDGLTSKEIGERLFFGFETIKKSRRSNFGINGVISGTAGAITLLRLSPE